MEERVSTGFNDMNQIGIYQGDVVLYNDATYLVILDKNPEIGWILHPTGNNPATDDIQLAEVAANVSVVQPVPAEE